ncbi:YjgP/YjgQ family permease [Antarcticibacterium flavum]|uniref:YjgP/YjgQ family permease n=1 Tax=Antarcticibacterium flavum TaxID=2058175 RepID=A0A5B7X660_9FLAO|nr:MULTISPECIES: LptF/LptG family permease [Antarcticibacterium]MCM4159654.1 permease [Antarcticibacterium sp. W02-3]QCY70897.1 YjgP/YjgQ family permease [Antarcticibacterium flavum]
MKILDKYILVSYLKTFFTVFIILMFIFVLQTIWLYIGELAGKDLDAGIIGRFLLYFSPKLIPLVLPLSILLTSIMVFGSFAENYEFAAMKSSGISLQRAMRSLTFFILFLSLTAFFFANNVIPAAEFKSINLRKNIAQLKPAMAISEGIFNEVGTFNIKVEKKTGDNDQFLEDVIIHEKSNQGGNLKVIKANRGELVGSTDSDVLSLILRDGNYYDEIPQNDPSKRANKPFAKSYFEEYVINIDISSFNDVDLADENYRNSQNMLKISELNQSIDSFSTAYQQEKFKFSNVIYNRSGASQIAANFTPRDSVREIDNSVLELYDTETGLQIVNLSLGSMNALVATVNIKKQEFRNSVKQLNKFEIALHEKYVLAFACVVLFFVGAPLGAIIRKGGMGLPMVVAILIFLTYHFIGIFAKNSAEDGSISPVLAAWLSTLIMMPLGILFTYRATTDQGLLSFSNITEPIGKFLKKLSFTRKETE